MEWRKTEGGYNANPYQVRWLNGGKWLARLNHRASSPEHLGTFESANEARAACEGHRGVSVSEVASRFGVSRQTIRTWMGESKPRFRHSEETKARYRELRSQGMSTRKAAAALGLSRGTVMDWEARQCS